MELPPAFAGSELQDQSPDADMSAGPSTISHNSTVQRTGDFSYNTAMSVQANQSSYNQWSNRVLPVQVTTYVPADTLNICTYSANNVPKPWKPRTCVTCKVAGKDGSVCPGKDRKDRCITKIEQEQTQMVQCFLKYLITLLTIYYFHRELRTTNIEILIHIM